MAAEPAIMQSARETRRRFWCEIRCMVRIATQYPANVAGIIGNEIIMCSMPKRPILNSITKDIKQLITKNAARLALMKSFSWCCITSAIGGPPIDVLVPMNPERKPAQKSDLLFALKTILFILRATATKTDRPNQSASAS